MLSPRSQGCHILLVAGRGGAAAISYADGMNLLSWSRSLAICCAVFLGSACGSVLRASPSVHGLDRNPGLLDAGEVAVLGSGSYGSTSSFGGTKEVRGTIGVQLGLAGDLQASVGLSGSHLASPDSAPGGTPQTNTTSQAAARLGAKYRLVKNPGHTMNLLAGISGGTIANAGEALTLDIGAQLSYQTCGLSPTFTPQLLVGFPVDREATAYESDTGDVVAGRSLARTTGIVGALGVAYELSRSRCERHQSRAQLLVEVEGAFWGTDQWAEVSSRGVAAVRFVF